METKKIKLAFFGAPDFAADVLQDILEDKEIPIELCFVVTQPDKPVGRKQIITPTPVKEVARVNKIPVLDSLQSPEIHEKLKQVDLVLLYAFGEIIPSQMLKIPRWGFWNIHPSLLPLYKGPSPIAYPLLLEDKKTGVSLVLMDDRLDHGPLIGQEEYIIQETDTRDLLENRLSKIGYKLFKKYIQILISGAFQKNEQNHSHATNTRLLTKQDGFVAYPIFQKIIKGEDLEKEDTPSIVGEFCTKYEAFLSPPRLSTMYYSLFRALSPWPGLWTKVSLSGSEKRLKITGMTLQNGKQQVTKVQLEGKKEVDLHTFRMAYASFLNL